MAEDFLAAMATSSRRRSAEAQALLPLATLEQSLQSLPPAPALVLSSDGFDLIAEMKLRSPAVGQLKAAAEDDFEQRIAAYTHGGAAAISVLTEPLRFDGALEHLQRAAALRLPRSLARASAETQRVPIMRKDFLVDRYQILEARVAGAGGVLLIVRMLDDLDLQALFDTALDVGLFVLLETFDEADVERAQRVIDRRRFARGEVLIGVNSRDLVSLQVVPERLESMVGCLPRNLPRVAESGVATADDAARLAAAGYELALVGSALMRAAEPSALVSAMLQAARAAR